MSLPLPMPPAKWVVALWPCGWVEEREDIVCDIETIIKCSVRVSHRVLRSYARPHITARHHSLPQRERERESTCAVLLLLSTIYLHNITRMHKHKDTHKHNNIIPARAHGRHNISARSISVLLFTHLSAQRFVPSIGTAQHLLYVTRLKTFN